MIDVCETFLSIQGESSYAGLPCFFVRLSGCNLRCSYCDSKYAYEAGTRRSIGELADEFKESGVRLAAVTGGEPLIQPASIELLKTLCPFGTVLLETNGSRDISAVHGDVVIIMDVKCPGSGEMGSLDKRNLNRLRRRDEVKFVIQDKEDFDYAVNMTESNRLDEKCNAVLMTPVYGVLSPLQLAEWILASHVRARLNIQIHKIEPGFDKRLGNRFA